MKSIIILITLFFYLQYPLLAQFTVVYTASTSGNWSSASTWTKSCPVASTNCSNFINATTNPNNTTPKTTYTTNGVSGNPIITILIVINSGVTVTLDTDYTFAEAARRITRMTVNGTLSSAQKTSSPVTYYSLSLEGTFNGTPPSCTSSSAILQVGSSGSINRVQNLNLSKACSIYNGPVYVNGNLANDNNSTMIVNNYFQVRGNWSLNNGNIETAGSSSGFVDVGGCVNSSPANNLSSSATTVKFCINGNGGCTSSPSNPQSQNPSNYNCTGTQLPISSQDWRAERTEQGVWLKWRTFAQSNLQSITIEKATQNFQFQPLAELDVASQSSKNHQYFDNQVLSQRTYYRLKETYYNDIVSYSSIVTASETSDIPTVRMYPNPLPHQQLNLEWLNPQDKVEVILLDNLGKIVYHKTALADSEGNLSLNLGSTPRGIYTVKIRQGYQWSMQKLSVEQ
ncbi:MAG: T9SS type A sorting domain-containing protein [Microscillaceae bacterium]|nr:T9SS type A sorting domain-containing protein [Microscillaceae bacterium]